MKEFVKENTMWLISHARETSHASAALHFLHLHLHLHHVRHHGFFDFRVFFLHPIHDGLFQLIARDALIDKERVFDLSLIDKHIDHHFHFVATWPLSLALLHSLHRKLLGLSEGRECL